MGVLEGVAVQLVVRLTLGALGLARRGGAALVALSRRSVVHIGRRARAWNARRLRDAAVRRAAETGETILAARRWRGHRWVLTWDGAERLETYRYPELPTYRHDMETRRTPPTRSTCCGKPPPIGTRLRRG